MANKINIDDRESALDVTARSATALEQAAEEPKSNRFYMRAQNLQKIFAVKWQSMSLIIGFYYSS